MKMIRPIMISLLLICGCSKSELIDTPKPRTKADTTYTPRAIQKDTSEVESSGIPIEFDVTIEDWE
jgi:hypothetical protein